MAEATGVFRYPQAAGRTPEEKIECLRRELMCMTDQLNRLDLQPAGAAQELRLGRSVPGCIRKQVADGAHRLWLGSEDETCGILFDFTAGTYELRGTRK